MTQDSRGTAAPAIAVRTSILHVTPYYPPDRIGGVGEVARVIHEGLLERGFRSEVLTSGRTRTDPRVHRVAASPPGFLLQSWRAARLSREFDLLHVHHGEALLLVLALRLRRRRPKILLMLHVDVRRREAADGPHTVLGRRFGPAGGRQLLRRFAGFGKAVMERAAWILADAVTVETRGLAAELSDLRPLRPVTVIPYGLGPAQAVDGSAVAVELLYVGTAGNRKRTHLLPLILERVRRTVPTARLRIVGFHPEGDPRIEREAERLGISEGIEFAGPLRSEEVVPFYRSADVLVLPSAYEGLPMVLLEAMREGLPPVATDVSGHPDAIEDGVNGFLVHVDDVDALAGRCATLLGNPTLGARMGEAAQRTVRQRFTTERQLEAYIGLYTDLLGANAG